jgi:hypothetical protein
VASLLYPGNTLSQAVLADAVSALERALRIQPAQRSQVCIRLDAGFGTDDNLNWLLRQRYQVVAKNNSGRRAGAWGQQVQEWQVLEPGRRWVAMPPQQLQFAAPTRTIAVRWLDERKNKLKHALYVVTDLQRPLVEMCHLYDLRGGAEVDIRDDKQGLLLTRRRKRSRDAQEMLTLLNDLAHNFLSMLRREVLEDTPLAAFGLYRLIRDVLSIPGEAIIADGRLLELRLAQSHPYAALLADLLPRLWQ